MKLRLLACIATSLLLVATVPSPAASETYFKAAVTGSVQTEIVIGLSDGRVHTAALDAKRIFTEFNVSPQDYALVFGTTSGLILIPRHSDSSLSTLTIFSLGTESLLIDTKAHYYKIEASIAPSKTANLFENLAGEIVLKAPYKGPFSFSPVFTSINLKVTARGTNQSSSSDSALLKFTVNADQPFQQQP